MKSYEYACIFYIFSLFLFEKPQEVFSQSYQYYYSYLAVIARKSKSINERSESQNQSMRTSC